MHNFSLGINEECRTRIKPFFLVNKNWKKSYAKLCISLKHCKYQIENIMWLLITFLLLKDKNDEIFRLIFALNLALLLRFLNTWRMLQYRDIAITIHFYWNQREVIWIYIDKNGREKNLPSSCKKYNFFSLC